MNARRVPPVLLGVFILLSAAAGYAQKPTLERLCRLHGIGDAEDIGAIGKTYAEAVDAGIREDELLPFVEDILRHKLDCPQMVRVLSAASQLARADLPYLVVFSKVREGVTKQASPALVVDVAESKLKVLTSARDVLKSLETFGYRVPDFRNAAVVVASYLDKGYTPEEVVTGIRKKGFEGAGFAALSGVIEKPSVRDAR